MVDKNYIENLVITECRKLLTAENILKIAKEVVAICETEKDTTNLKRLKKLLSENERKYKNLINAVQECDMKALANLSMRRYRSWNRNTQKLRRKWRWKENPIHR